MSGPVQLPLERPFHPVRPGRDSPCSAVSPGQDRLPEPRLGGWLAPVIDLLAAAAALALVVLPTTANLNPDLVLAPILLVAINSVLGVYGSKPPRGTARIAESGAGELAVRLLVAVCFAWFVSLLAPVGAGAQLALCGSFLLLDSVARALSSRLTRGSSPERWILVGDESIAQRLKDYRPLRDHATIVCAVAPPGDCEMSGAKYRNGALAVVDRYDADRVVIASQGETDEDLLALMRAFKAIGVAVSLLPRPLDLVEAPAATPSRVGGVSLIDVDALAAHDAVPYSGPNRRRPDRRPQVSVVVPAMNEERNIGPVLSQLPDDLHEVILVDGNSEDETVAAAQRAYPQIRVVTQAGRGKGDALRAGFAAVTGNLIVMLDADGSADPGEIPRFVRALEEGADFAKGSRFIEGGGSTDITTLRRVGNSFLSLTVNVLHRTAFTDLCYGYNAFWTRCLPYISLDVPGFEVETLINLRIAAAGMKVTEVPSHESDRVYGQSNLNTFRDGFRVLRTIVSETRRRRSIARHWSPPKRREAGRAEIVLP